MPTESEAPMSDNTARSFRDKWEQNPTLALAQTLDERSEIFRWILGRNGFRDAVELRAFLAGKARVLDAGCGNGRVTALLRAHSDAGATEIVGIDLVAADVARRNLAQLPNVKVLQKDLLGDLADLGRFDFIYCQEVLHHTADPERAFRNVASLLAPGGEIAIYVYARKAPVREFVDDYVRSRVAELPYEEVIRASEQITALGKSLAEAKVEIEVPDIPVLGIAAGRYDVQRFVYHFFMKCFWNPELSFHDNAVINYDWYHPQLCSRHTLEEVRGWFGRAGLAITHEFVDFYGITVRGRRQ
jgi:SAM-dependent methyltransferase